VNAVGRHACLAQGALRGRQRAVGGREASMTPLHVHLLRHGRRHGVSARLGALAAPALRRRLLRLLRGPGGAIPHPVQVVHEALRAPWVDLAVQWCGCAMLHPPPDIIRVRQLRPIQKVVPLQPREAAHPTHLVLGEGQEAAAPLVHLPRPLDSGSGKMHRRFRPALGRRLRLLRSAPGHASCNTL